VLVGDLIQLIVSGIATGAIYALAALGFTLLWQAAGVINFAQGEFVMLPAFAMLFCVAAGAPLWLAFLIACAAANARAGSGLQARDRRSADSPRRDSAGDRDPRLVGRPQVGGEGRLQRGSASVSQRVPAGQFAVAGVNISYADIGTLVLAGAIVVGLQAFLNKTITGRAMQAVAQNTESARVLGINVPRMVMYTFLINAVLAGRRGPSDHPDVPREVRHGRRDRDRRRFSRRSSAASTRRAGACSAAC
jgi:branched-chain amino acid transport system permease protein